MTIANNSMKRTQLQHALYRAGWWAVASDVRDGVKLEVVLDRLNGIGEGDSDAYNLVLAAIQEGTS